MINTLITITLFLRDTFIPYRDSTLTWLLKENLGGNSRTVMVATISPADDNYEETLSTLRYADRAKKITNHAVVNEDQNAKIIRELRAEVEMLRKILSTKTGNESEDLLDKITENENFMKTISLTWTEKRSGQNIGERRQALERMGVHLDSRGAKEGFKSDGNQFYISRLSSDPSMNEVLIYYLKDNTTKVGTDAASVEQDIKLKGLGIKSEHCFFIRENEELFVSSVESAATCINGRTIVEKTKLEHGDRMLLGSNNFFRVYCSQAKLEPFDWNNAQAEVMMDHENNNVLDNIFTNLTKKYNEERNENFDKNDESIINWLDDKDSSFRDAQFRKSLEKLKSGWLSAASMVRDANVVAKELERPVKYSITLQIPPEKLSANNSTGVFVEDPSILVKSIKNGCQIWTLEKLDSRLKDMIDIYDKVTTDNLPYSEIGVSLPDPFFDSIENHVLIGVANIHLQPLFHDIKFEYNTPIIAQDGRMSGKLLMELHRTSGHMEMVTGDSDNSEVMSESSKMTTSTNDEDISQGQQNMSMKFRFSIKSVSGLPQSLSHFVFCQYTFMGMEPVVIPSLPKQSKTSGSAEFIFNFAQDYNINISDSFRSLCKTGVISVQVFGQKSKGFFSIREALRDRRRAQTVGERYSVAHPDLCWVCFNLNLKCEHRNTRWSELVRNIQLWVEIQVK